MNIPPSGFHFTTANISTLPPLASSSPPRPELAPSELLPLGSSAVHANFHRRGASLPDQSSLLPSVQAPLPQPALEALERLSRVGQLQQFNTLARLASAARQGVIVVPAVPGGPAPSVGSGPASSPGAPHLSRRQSLSSTASTTTPSSPESPIDCAASLAMDEEEEDGEDPSNTDNRLRKNTREKQRRQEIQKKFDVLARMLSVTTTAPRGKLDKDAVLAQAISHISALREANRTLATENLQLTTELFTLAAVLEETTTQPRQKPASPHHQHHALELARQAKSKAEMVQRRRAASVPLRQGGAI